MSVVIVGGHDRMVCQYKDICKACGCEAKVFTQPRANMESLIGTPDLIVLFTHPISHKMAKIARRTAAKGGVTLAQSHCGSGHSLRCILRDRVAGEA